MKWRKLKHDKSNQLAGNESHRKWFSANDIGCFIVLEPEEFTDFPIGEMEFVEMLFLEESMFLHGVRIIDESYGEDIYLPVEVVRC